MSTQNLNFVSNANINGKNFSSSNVCVLQGFPTFQKLALVANVTMYYKYFSEKGVEIPMFALRPATNSLLWILKASYTSVEVKRNAR